MLLYVNKKAIRQKKIRITLIIFFSILFIFANIICFKQTFHTSSKTPNNYTSIKKEALFIETYPIIEAYTTKNNATKLILIPKNLTKQASHKLAHIFTHEKTASVFITNELNNNKTLLDIIKFFNIEISQTISTNTVVISSDTAKATPIIYQEKLYPSTIIYQEFKDNNFAKMLEQHFYKKAIATDNLSNEARALNDFITDYKDELINLVKNNKLNKQKFAQQDGLLQNIKFCLKTNKQVYCDIEDKISFAKKISKILQTIPQQETIKKLILLTSFEETTPQTFAPNCGLLFKFNKRNAILLPEEITPEAFNNIKIKAGINPAHTNNIMTFYQFKTAEIILNDNI
jgi:hypothetical protein